MGVRRGVSGQINVLSAPVIKGGQQDQLAPVSVIDNDPVLGQDDLKQWCRARIRIDLVFAEQAGAGQGLIGTTSMAMSTSNAPARPIMSAPNPRVGSSAR